MIRSLLLLTLLFVASLSYGQVEDKWKLSAMGIETQAYPAGMMYSAIATFDFDQQNEFLFKAGYNIARRKDFGEHDNEEGGGPGFGLAWKHYLGPNKSRLYFSVRNSFWFMKIDWQDNSPNRQGTTHITVLQPSVSAGYDFRLSHSITLGIFSSLGYEVNLITSGEAVGQGGISMVGLGFNYRL